jgi:hypothetical protein
MPNIETNNLAPDDNFLVCLDSEIWLMDNHKWAFLVWEKFKLISDIPKFSLIHADYHWDGVNDFYSAPEKESELLNSNIDQLHAMVAEGNWIRFDSFIAPAVIRGSIGEIHFFCTQDEGEDNGIDEDILSRMSTRQFFHDNMVSLSNQKFSFPVIFDLCLDLFDTSIILDQGEHWPDSEIIEFLTSMKPIIQAASVVTVSLSFGYSGSEEDTRRLAKLVLPILQKWRHS